MSRQNVVSLNASSSTVICCLLENSRRCTKPALARKVFTKRIEKYVQQKQLNVRPDPMAKHTNICLMHRRLLAPSAQQQRALKPTAALSYGPTAAAGGDINVADDGGGSDFDEDTPQPPPACASSSSSQQHNATPKRPTAAAAPTNNNSAGSTLANFRLNSLSASTLRRYKKFFKLPSRPGLNKQQLVDLASDHFKNIEVDERKIVTYFIYSVKTKKNQLDRIKSPVD